MEIFDDSFSIELNSPLDDESWKVLEDAEFDNTEHVWFKTPNGKRVDFIKADVLDKIRVEIEQDAFKGVDGSKYIFVNRVNQIIDKYKAENTVDF